MRQPPVRLPLLTLHRILITLSDYTFGDAAEASFPCGFESLGLVRVLCRFSMDAELSSAVPACACDPLISIPAHAETVENFSLHGYSVKISLFVFFPHKTTKTQNYILLGCEICRNMSTVAFLRTHLGFTQGYLQLMEESLRFCVQKIKMRKWMDIYGKKQGLLEEILRFKGGSTKKRKKAFSTGRWPTPFAGYRPTGRFM